MAYFPWDPALETGNGLIDEQHKSLFALADALQEAVACRCDDAEAVANAVYGLTDYVVEHFDDEEELMRRHGYPQLSVHHQLHQQLTAETMRLATRYFNGEDLVPDSIAPFLAGWLADHIRKEDMRFAEYVASQQGG